MWQDKISALKYSLLGGAMLVLAGCGVNPRSAAGSTPTQTTHTDKNRQAQAHKPGKPRTTALTRMHKIPAVTQANSTASLEKVTWCARKQQGRLYCWGGSSPKTGFDCSGLTQYAFQQGAGVSLPRTAAAQYNAALKVPETEARKGDLVFFKTRGKQVSHVGIYLGDNRFIHAPRTGKSITTSKLSGYWKRHLVGFGRIQGACRPVYS
jgi:cell wall-associated NlpC family hydrolase